MTRPEESSAETVRRDFETAIDAAFSGAGTWTLGTTISSPARSNVASGFSFFKSAGLEWYFSAIPSSGEE